MPLSEHEQRIFDQIEEQLRADDPALAKSISQDKSVQPGVVILGILIVLVGLGTLVAAVATNLIWLGAIGFIVAFAGVLVALRRSEPAVASDADQSAPVPGPSPAAQESTSSSLMDRLNDRWDRRQDQ